MLENLHNKKIAILGLGTNNQKLSEYFEKNNLKFQALEWKNISDVVGELDNFDIVFRTPGFPYTAEAIVRAQQKGVEISSQTKLFFDLCPCPIIGVTGTKGKGTTASLIAKILEDSGEKVWLGGNIGRDPFEFLDFIHPNDYCVLELSSFQLEDLHKSPHIAVVLNITADHLEVHKTIEAYMTAKLNIVKFQTPNDFAVLSHELPKTVAEIGDGQKIIFKPEDVSDYHYQLIGKFYLENIAAAADVGKILNIPESTIRKSVSEFKGLPHRMQKIGIKDGITYINDSLGTNEDTAIAAISAIDTPIILILGGSDKGLNYQKLAVAIQAHTNIKGVVVVGQETEKILKALAGFGGKISQGASNMKEIITQARSMASAGDTILLSPAAASFGMFKNYADRGQQFAQEALK